MESQTNLENLDSIGGLPKVNLNSSPTSADAPLLHLLNLEFHEMKPEDAKMLVEQLRSLRKSPQKLSSKLTEGTTEKRSVRKKTIQATKVANLLNEYADL